MPLPGDIVFTPKGQLQRFTLEDGWQIHDGFRGDYEEGMQYNAGDVVIRGGAMWICTPEQGPDTWTCVAGNGGQHGPA